MQSHSRRARVGLMCDPFTLLEFMGASHRVHVCSKFHHRHDPARELCARYRTAPGSLRALAQVVPRRTERETVGAGVEWNNGAAISRESCPRGMIRVVITDFVLMKISWLSRGGGTNVSGKEECAFRTQIVPWQRSSVTNPTPLSLKSLLDDRNL